MNRQSTKPRPTCWRFGILAWAVATPIAVMFVNLALADPLWSKQPERTSSGEVQITLTPRDLSDGRLRIDAVFTTHRGDLGELDLMSAAELHVAGQTLRPTKAPALRGHHARGPLEFALDKMPDAFEIVIHGVRNQGDAIFRWP